MRTVEDTHKSTSRRAWWPKLVGLLVLLLILPAGEVLQPVPVAATPIQEYWLYLPTVQSDDPFQSFLPILASPMEPGSSQHAGTLSTQHQSGFVQRVGENLQLNGQPYSFIGTNVSWLAGPFFPETAAEQIVSFLAGTGVQVIRVWVAPWCDLDRVERLVDLAGKYNIRLILTLQDFFGYEDGYPFVYLVESRDLPHIRNIVPRFANRPEVLMWELMNEPTCPAKDSGQSCWDALYRWAEVTSAEIKRLDPNHLVAVGTQRAGFDDLAKETFRRVHALETIDLVSVHRGAGGLPEKELAIAHELGKPVYFGEIHLRGHDESCQALSKDALERRAQAIGQDLQASQEAGVDGYLLWQYAYGGVDMGSHIEYFCGVYDYFGDDPVWSVVQAAKR